MPYTFTPVNGAPFVSTIGGILANQGNAQAVAATQAARARANAAAMSGDIWGRAIQQAGQIPNQVIAQRQADVEQAQQREVRQATIDAAKQRRTDEQHGKAQDDLF